ncbi:50S ribosomal protein L10 [Striga asiatica]|uniref:50S ribosomal protein L10 n=1 Tax=Striga asiatica TaxID=4170 RepID=A0A5A7QHY9_STRAF|nr:50S ribosomal protein L10 [Striga asiatica]
MTSAKIADVTTERRTRMLASYKAVAASPEPTAVPLTRAKPSLGRRLKKVSSVLMSAREKAWAGVRDRPSGPTARELGRPMRRPAIDGAAERETGCDVGIEELGDGIKDFKADAGVALEEGVDAHEHGGACGGGRQSISLPLSKLSITQSLLALTPASAASASSTTAPPPATAATCAIVRLSPPSLTIGLRNSATIRRTSSRWLPAKAAAAAAQFSGSAHNPFSSNMVHQSEAKTTSYKEYVEKHTSWQRSKRHRKRRRSISSKKLVRWQSVISRALALRGPGGAWPALSAEDLRPVGDVHRDRPWTRSEVMIARFCGLFRGISVRWAVGPNNVVKGPNLGLVELESIIERIRANWLDGDGHGAAESV